MAQEVYGKFLYHLFNFAVSLKKGGLFLKEFSVKEETDQSFASFFGKTLLLQFCIKIVVKF